MSEKNIAFMKSVLEKKKEKQATKLAQSERPLKKMGSSQAAFKNQKQGSAKKV